MVRVHQCQCVRESGAACWRGWLSETEVSLVNKLKAGRAEVVPTSTAPSATLSKLR